MMGMDLRQQSGLFALPKQNRIMSPLGAGYWVAWIHHWSNQVGHFLAAYSNNVQNRASLCKVLYQHIARNKFASISLLFQ